MGLAGLHCPSPVVEATEASLHAKYQAIAIYTMAAQTAVEVASSNSHLCTDSAAVHQRLRANVAVLVEQHGSAKAAVLHRMWSLQNKRKGLCEQQAWASRPRPTEQSCIKCLVSNSTPLSASACSLQKTFPTPLHMPYSSPSQSCRPSSAAAQTSVHSHLPLWAGCISGCWGQGSFAAQACSRPSAGPSGTAPSSGWSPSLWEGSGRRLWSSRFSSATASYSREGNVRSQAQVKSAHNGVEAGLLSVNTSAGGQSILLQALHMGMPELVNLCMYHETCQ